MWRERIDRRELDEVVGLLEKTQADHLGRTWARQLRVWRERLTSDDCLEAEIEAEIARVYAFVWSSSLWFRTRFPEPEVRRAWRASQARREGATRPQGGSFREVAVKPRVAATAGSRKFSQIQIDRATAILHRRRPMPRLPTRVSKSDLGNLLDLGGRHLQKLAARGIVVRAEDGGFELGPSLRGYLAHVTADAQRRAGSAAEDGLRSAKAAAMEARFAREDRNLVSMEDTRAVLSNIVEIFAQALASLPAELGRSGDARLAEIVANAEVALRRKLAEQMAKLEGGR